jgi:hypothetical protein
MSKFFRSLSYGVLALVMATSFEPVEAMPLGKVVAPQQVSGSVGGEIIFVQSGRRSSGRNSSRNDNWRGYRGSRNRCRNCRRRRNDGLWYPAAAFAAGAIVGSAASRPRTVHHVHHVAPSRHNSRHVAWCRNRFRTYRVSDNTFQPNNGPRRQCHSPYR